ncbi:MAG: hypothetical protein U0559_16520 [Anaerolineae bacterium]
MSGTMKFDFQSALELRWGTTDEAIIKHGQAFLAFEASRPVSEQLKDLSPAFFTTLVDAAQEAATEAGLGEAARAHAAEAVRQIDAQLPALVDKIIMQLKLHYASNLADLKLYGLETNVGPRGIVVKKPKNPTDRRAFCLAYVEQETSLPTAQQITDPPLSQLTAIADILRQNQTARTAQTTRRQINVATRTAASQTLLDALQAAAAVLIVLRFGGKVTFDLQQWGYDVVAKTAPQPKPIEPTPTEPTNP